MARLFDNTGSERLSAIYHTRVFNRNPQDFEQLYVALTRNIDAGRDREIKRLGKKFFLEIDSTERERIIKVVDNYLIKNTPIELVALTCPDDDLRRNVIRVLLAHGKNQSAVDIFLGISAVRPSFAILEFENAAYLPATVRQFFIEHYNAVDARTNLTGVEYLRASLFLYQMRTTRDTI